MRHLGTPASARTPAAPRRVAGERLVRLGAGALLFPLVVSALAGAPASADDADAAGDVPSRSEVRSAEAAADEGGRAVTTVQADLAVAQIVLDRSAVAAQKAAEAFNGARYAAQQARGEAQDARAAERAAREHVERVRLAYADVVRGSLGSSSDLEALSSMMSADGLTALLALSSSYRIVGGTLDARYDDLTDAREEASEARETAIAARAEAKKARREAAVKRRDAATTAREAATTVTAMEARTQDLLAELARLQGISVQVAESRQEGLAQVAAERSAERAAQAAAARAAAEAAAVEAAGEKTRTEKAAQAKVRRPGAAPDRSPAPTSTPQPTPEATPQPTPPPTPQPAPQPTPSAASEPGPTPTAPAPTAPAPTAPASGAQAAIAFARSQLGEPYVWAAAGPSSWDCSGLTMGAWAAGGKSLPHYSVAQYDAATPIAAAQRQPGDLVFWATSSDPSSIYHVALYVGDDMIIHAPRTGRPVSEDSLFYWIAPTFYARP